jgi:hypothetical protein
MPVYTCQRKSFWSLLLCPWQTSMSTGHPLYFNRKGYQTLSVCCKVLLQSPAPGQNLMSDTLCLIIGFMRSCLAGPMKEKLPFPHCTWHFASTLQLSGESCRLRPSFPSPTRHVHIQNTAASIQRPVYWSLAHGIFFFLLFFFWSTGFWAQYLELAR